jgi:hypothetical protein
MRAKQEVLRLLELVTDRAKYHVDMLKRLRKKAWSNMNPSEQAAWYGEAAKGAYNYTDLNRVESAVATVGGILGLSLTTKTNWTKWDIPSKSEMDRYLGNVAKIRNHCASVPNLPPLPSSMNGLNYTDANNIELVLLRAYEFAMSSIQSGEIYSGEV